MDVTTLSPEQISALKLQLDSTDSSGRSQMRPRQLHNLNFPPTATDPRPLFVWSAEGDRNMPPGAGTPYPKLLWHGETNQEITVKSHSEEAEMLGLGYVNQARRAVVVDAVADLSEQFAGLSLEEQRLILDLQQKSRMDTLMAKMANLSDVQLERLLASAETAPKKRGRPAKVA